MDQNISFQIMEEDINGHSCLFFGNRKAENVLFQLTDDHESESLKKEYELIREATDADFCLMAIKVKDWNQDLSPWKAAPVFGNREFGDGAEDTLRFVVSQVIKDEGRKWYLGGYSLAGLFALWAGYQSDVFSGIAGVSPSVWFPGWKEYFLGNEIRTTRVYLSLGDKEEKTRNRVMAEVGNNIRQMYEHLSPAAECILEWNPGNHFTDPDKRMAKGFLWLLNE